MTHGPGSRSYTPRSARSGRAGAGDPWVQRLGFERALHDGAALRLSALSVRLGLARHELSTDDPAVEELIDEVHEELVAALQDLRQLGSKLYPPLLHASGLHTAISETVVAMRLPVEITASGRRFGPAAEGVAYFAVVDCLPILTRHRSRVEVAIEDEKDTLTVRLAGCPPGVDYDLAVEAIDTVSESIVAAGGSCEVVASSSPTPHQLRGDTVIMMRLPCE